MKNCKSPESYIVFDLSPLICTLNVMDQLLFLIFMFIIKPHRRYVVGLFVCRSVGNSVYCGKTADLIEKLF